MWKNAMTILARRWYLFVWWLMAMVIVLLAVDGLVATKYEATGQVLVLPPSQPVVQGEPVNPYLNLPGSLTFTATLLADTVGSPDTAKQLQSAGFTSTYSLSVVAAAGPLITVSVEDRSPEAAIKTRDELVTRLDQELARIQTSEGVEASQLMEARAFNVSSEASPLNGDRVRAIAAVIAVGLVALALILSAMRREALAMAAEPQTEPSEISPLDGQDAAPLRSTAVAHSAADGAPAASGKARAEPRRSRSERVRERAAGSP